MIDATPFSVRARGSLLASAAGDALGWPQEFRGNLRGGKRARDARMPHPGFDRWERNGGSQFSGRFVDPVDAGTYSDDTQLTLAVARSLNTGQFWWEHFSLTELPAWLLYQRGGGAATVSAARSWSRARPPWVRGTTQRDSRTSDTYWNAGGNGAAMRVAPHAISALARGLDREDSDVLALHDALATHGHPEAILGSQMMASALRHCLESRHTIEYGELLHVVIASLPTAEQVVPVVGHYWNHEFDPKVFAALWTRTVARAESLLRRSLQSLERGSMSDPVETLTEMNLSASRPDGTGVATAAGAIYLASRFASQPMTALLSACYLPSADTDTLGAMTGSILGSVHGPGWLRRLVEVQDATYIERLANDLALPPSQLSSSERVSDRDLADFRRRLGAMPIGAVGHFVDGREFRLVQTLELEGRAAIRRLILETRDGQKLTLDLAGSRAPRDAEPPRDPEEDRSRPRSIATRASITLPTSDVLATARFYARLTDAEVVVRNGEARITGSLSFRSGTVPAVSEGHIRLYVKDLDRVAEVVNSSIQEDSGGRFVHTIDLDGRPLRIEAN